MNRFRGWLTAVYRRDGCARSGREGGEDATPRSSQVPRLSQDDSPSRQQSEQRPQEEQPQDQYLASRRAAQQERRGLLHHQRDQIRQTISGLLDSSGASSVVTAQAPVEACAPTTTSTQRPKRKEVKISLATATSLTSPSASKSSKRIKTTRSPALAKPTNTPAVNAAGTTKPTEPAQAPTATTTGTTNDLSKENCGNATTVDPPMNTGGTSTTKPTKALTSVQDMPQDQSPPSVQELHQAGVQAARARRSFVLSQRDVRRLQSVRLPVVAASRVQASQTAFRDDNGAVVPRNQSQGLAHADSPGSVDHRRGAPTKSPDRPEQRPAEDRNSAAATKTPDRHEQQDSAAQTAPSNAASATNNAVLEEIAQQAAELQRQFDPTRFGLLEGDAKVIVDAFPKTGPEPGEFSSSKTTYRDRRVELSQPSSPNEPLYKVLIGEGKPQDNHCFGIFHVGKGPDRKTCICFDVNCTTKGHKSKKVTETLSMFCDAVLVFVSKGRKDRRVMAPIVVGHAGEHAPREFHDKVKAMERQEEAPLRSIVFDCMVLRQRFNNQVQLLHSQLMPPAKKERSVQPQVVKIEKCRGPFGPQLYPTTMARLKANDVRTVGSQIDPNGGAKCVHLTHPPGDALKLQVGKEFYFHHGEEGGKTLYSAVDFIRNSILALAKGSNECTTLFPSLGHTPGNGISTEDHPEVRHNNLFFVRRNPKVSKSILADANIDDTEDVVGDDTHTYSWTPLNEIPGTKGLYSEVSVKLPEDEYINWRKDVLAQNIGQEWFGQKRFRYCYLCMGNGEIEYGEDGTPANALHLENKQHLLLDWYERPLEAPFEVEKKEIDSLARALKNHCARLHPDRVWALCCPKSSTFSDEGQHFGPKDLVMKALMKAYEKSPMPLEVCRRLTCFPRLGEFQWQLGKMFAIAKCYVEELEINNNYVKSFGAKGGANEYKAYDRKKVRELAQKIMGEISDRFRQFDWLMFVASGLAGKGNADVQARFLRETINVEFHRMLYRKQKDLFPAIRGVQFEVQQKEYIRNKQQEYVAL